MDISAPGLYDDPADLTPATIPAGTVVDSHLLHFDIVFAGVAIARAGTVQFADRILGVVLTDVNVDASDGLGATGTTYPAPGGTFRGAELFETDAIEVGCDTITVSLEAFEALDHVRVITAHEEPCHDDGDGEDHEGCTPGFWKQCASRNARLRAVTRAAWAAAGVNPEADLDATFGTTFFPSNTLCEGTNLGGGGKNRLARHGTAALLNASHPGVLYPLTPAEVIALVRARDADTLAELNELGCPLDRGKDQDD